MILEKITGSATVEQDLTHLPDDLDMRNIKDTRLEEIENCQLCE